MTEVAHRRELIHTLMTGAAPRSPPAARIPPGPDPRPAWGAALGIGPRHPSLARWTGNGPGATVRHREAGAGPLRRSCRCRPVTSNAPRDVPWPWRRAVLSPGRADARGSSARAKGLWVSPQRTRVPSVRSSRGVPQQRPLALGCCCGGPRVQPPRTDKGGAAARQAQRRPPGPHRPPAIRVLGCHPSPRHPSPERSQPSESWDESLRRRAGGSDYHGDSDSQGSS